MRVLRISRIAAATTAVAAAAAATAAATTIAAEIQMVPQPLLPLLSVKQQTLNEDKPVSSRR